MHCRSQFDLRVMEIVGPLFGSEFTYINSNCTATGLKFFQSTTSLDTVHKSTSNGIFFL